MGEGENPGASIAGQAIRGSVYSMAASLVTLALGFLRAVLLARLLLPEHFGVVALALFYIRLAAQLRGLGLDAALIHRQDAAEPVVRTYFALRIGSDVAAAGLLLASGPLLQWAYPGMHGLGAIFPFLILAYLLSNLSQVQETLLRKQLAFSAVAATDVVASAVMTVVAPYVAWRGWGVWALVAEVLSGLATRSAMTWGPFRCWRPCLGWDRAAARWFWGYGKPNWVASNLSYLLDGYDDFWVGTALGGVALGLYAKAYEMALYPRRIFANPLISVLGPVFARLQHDRLQLSRAFYRATHFTLRTGILIGGAFALAMPEFIHFVIGDKWLPLLWAFRLMLVYTVLDPLLALVESLLLAVGRPRSLQRARLVQMAFFLPAVVLGARLWGINGVAVAADGMLVVGAWQLYRPVREVVDFSVTRLVAWPAVAAAIGWGAGLWLEAFMGGPAMGILLAKLAVFAALGAGLVLLAEREDYLRGVRWLWEAMRTRGATA